MQQKQKYIDSRPQEKKDNRLFIAACVFVVAAIASYWVMFEPSKSQLSSRLVITTEKIEGNKPVKPYLPDISGITVESVEQKVPALIKGKVAYSSVTPYPELDKFMEGDAPRRLRLIQRKVHPRALIVKYGSYNWQMLYDEVSAIDPDGNLIRKDGDVYTLRVPLLVLDGASLVISGEDVSELRLSKQANAYLANAGDFFIIRTKVVGWDEEKIAPTYFVDKHDYRPFITNWAGGNLYLAGSEFVSLGYLKGKSYGISYSACVACAKIVQGKVAATGIIVGNKFSDLFYGFYSYEAEDVAIIDNVYIDNVIYAIDPHDRSRRLIIAKNETYGTKKKHGIIISREVNDSWIFGNYSHHNKGSGIMLDRTCVNNVVADNIVEYNQQDGITFFESENNTSWGNIVRYNKKNGIRIRNSWDIKLYNDEIDANDGTSIEVYSQDISGQMTRDFDLDPYTQRANAVINGAKISTSGVAVFKTKMAEYLRLTNIDIRAVTNFFPASFKYDHSLLRDNISNENIMIKIVNPDDVHVAP